MNLECRILPTSTRNLRQTKAEMRRELEELRWNMRQGTDGAHPHSTPSNVEGQTFSPLEPGSGTFSHPSVPPTDASTSLSPAFESGHSRVGSRKGSPQGATLPRILDGYVVEAKRIDDCFTLYEPLQSS